MLGACLALSACPALAAASPARAAIKLGVYTPGAPASAAVLSEYAAMVGRPPDIVMSYRDFGLPLLYSNEAANLRATGQTPLVSWEPQQPLADIASGTYDAYLHEQAAAAKSWGSTLMVRFGHEMNGDWYSWAGSPEAFVAAWRHIVSVFRADGVANVQWVWSPNVQEGAKYPISPYFPGDEWIDYVGLDGYNWGTAGGSWQSLQEVFSPSYSLVTQLSSKPVMITETSSSETGGSKASWIRSGFMSAIPQAFPRVAAVIWFNRTQEDDWRIDSSQASLDAYRAVVSCSLYGGSDSCASGSVAGEAEAANKRVSEPALRSLWVTRVVGGSAARRRGAISYALTRRARVRIEIHRRTTSHWSAWARLTRGSHAGRTRLPLRRLMRGRRMPRGVYRVNVILVLGGSRPSKGRQARFRAT